jgi:serine/threonine protein kinase
VRIYHADVTPEGQLFYAMELLTGRDLEQVIQAEGCLAQDRAIGLVCQLLAGLGAAHEADLVHADIKPANILIVPGRGGERVVLVDFGLARLRTRDAPTRSVGGTPAYMAPEQLRNGRVDARSDLFAAALVLVTLLTGWRRRAKHELAPPLDDIGDAALRDTLRRALSIDPAGRFQTAAELAAAMLPRGWKPAGPAAPSGPPAIRLRRWAERTPRRLRTGGMRPRRRWWPSLPAGSTAAIARSTSCSTPCCTAAPSSSRGLRASARRRSCATG